MGAASTIARESCFRHSVEREVASSFAVEISSAHVDPAPRPGANVLLVLNRFEQRQPQAPLRLAKAMVHELSPQAARHLAQLLELAAARAEAQSAEAAHG